MLKGMRASKAPARPWQGSSGRRDTQCLACRTQVQVTEKMCEAEGCSTGASYGFAGEEKQRCKAHSLAGMVRAWSLQYT